MAESADATDLKSVDGDIVWVRPPLALLKAPGIRGFFTPKVDYFLSEKKIICSKFGMLTRPGNSHSNLCLLSPEFF